MLGYIRTEHNWGPRGDYYDWCQLEDDGTLSFGSEEGNYAGGTTLSVNYFYGTTLQDYVNEVKKCLSYWEKKDITFYDKIVRMMEENNITLDGILNSGVEFDNLYI